MSLIPSRRTLTLTGAAVVAGVLPLMSLTTGATAAEGPTTTYSKKLTYQCDVTVSYLGSTLTLPDFPVTATVGFAVPALKPYQTVAPTQINVALQLDENLRSATTGLLNGIAADGASTNVHLFVKSALDGSRGIYDIAKLSAPKSPIPTEANSPWIINASGTSPEIRVPSASSVTIQGPEKFDIDATIYQSKAPGADDGSEPTQQPARLACDTQLDRTVAVIPVGEKTTVTPRLPASIKAGTATSFRTEVRGASTKPTGQLLVALEDGTVVNNDGNNQLNANGDIRVPLPKFGKLGKRTLTISYGGDDNHGAITVKKTFTVTR